MAKNGLTRESLLRTLRDQSRYLSLNYGVRRIGLFGSFAKGEQKRTSDVDLLVELEKPLGFKFIDMTEYLEKLVGRKLDVLTPAGLKGIRLKKTTESIERELIYV
jgi:predicted nucleotidyltransferase